MGEARFKKFFPGYSKRPDPSFSKLGELEEEQSQSESQTESSIDYPRPSYPSAPRRSSVFNMAKEEEMMGKWPRRLLHVPTMTSVEWQPGNIYGGYRSPKYNVISYTWGRWRLKEGHKVDVRSLKIRGITWSIPRIDPAHFTALQLHQAIKEATTVRSGSSNDHQNEAVEFIWIDIACIDQTGQEQGSLADVGRQASIFRQASQVYIWITTKTASDFERLVGVLRAIPTASDKAVAHIQPAFKCLNELMEDPWFSSLWTLEEAFLRTSDAEFISREGRLMQTTRPGGLRYIVSVATRLDNVCDQIISQDSPEKHWGQHTVQTSRALSDMVSEKGLRALDSRHPVAVYREAMERTASKECDYVYGIQQVFDLRVGSSSVLTGSQRPHARSELEEELAEHLLTKQPVLSQLHLRSDPVTTFGTGWRITKSSIVPVNSFLTCWTTIDHGTEDLCAPACHFNTHKVGNTVWAQFEGPACSFKDFEYYCHRLDRDPGKMVPPGSTVLHVLLDNIPELQKCPQVRLPQDSTELDAYGVRLGSRMKACRKWLAHQYGNKLVVLLLGRRIADDANPYQRLGLLLLWRPSLSSPGRYWQRIGVCQWCFKWPGLQVEPNLQGDGKVWKRSEGLFG